MKMTSEQQDEAIYNEVVVESRSKAEVAREYDVSPRTVGRAIDRFIRKEEEKLRCIDDSFIDEFDEEDDVVEDYLDEIEEGEEDENDPTYQVVASSNSITIWKDSDSRTVTKGDPSWNEISADVWSSRGDPEVLRGCFDMLDSASMVNARFYGMVHVDPSSNTVLLENKEVPFRLHNRIVDAAYKGDDDEVMGLCLFTEKLFDNPSYRSVQCLFDFLEASDIEINGEGDVVCFKKVTSDFKDVRTKEFDNSPGATPSMPRNEVDEDPDSPCSNGLHVCSKGYLDFYWGSKIVRVLVHPADFVAVPRDHDHTKARVCEYHVEADVTGDMSSYL